MGGCDFWRVRKACFVSWIGKFEFNLSFVSCLDLVSAFFLVLIPFELNCKKPRSRCGVWCAP